MGIYTKSKTTVSNIQTTDIDHNENTFKVGIKSGAESIIINYLTNLYSNPATAVCRELFTNASDASDNSLPIYITLKQEENGSYYFNITDYGSGMSAKQLKNNYITYANSSKVEDFDTIGSFGLGSKSPMALVPEYIVESNNGKEQNIATVARTKTGIFANIEKSDNFDKHSFTSVSFSGINYNYASRMNTYINEYIIPFSNRSVHYNSSFTNGTNDLESIKIGENVTVYSKNLKEALCNLHSISVSNVFNYFKVKVRINNTVYDINNVYDYFQGHIIVDVEPGYFSFAPSREQVPDGEKKDHIKDIISDAMFDKTYADTFINFMVDNNIATHKEMFYLTLVSHYKINDYSCFNCSKNDTEYYKGIIEVNNCKDADYTKNFPEGIEVFCISGNYRNRYYDNNFKLRERHLVKVNNIADFVKAIKSVSKFKLIKDDVEMKLGVNGNACVSVSVIKGSKFTRKGEAVQLSDYKITALRKKSESILRNMYNNLKGGEFSYLEFVIYLKEGIKLPKDFENYLNISCSTIKDNKVEINNIDYVNYKECINEKLNKVKAIEDRYDSFYVIDANNTASPCKLQNCYYGSDDFNEMVKGVKYFYNNTNSFMPNDTNTHKIALFSYINKCKVIVKDDKTKIVKNYLNSLGIEEIDKNFATELLEELDDKCADAGLVSCVILSRGVGCSEMLDADDIRNYPDTTIAIAINNDYNGLARYKECFDVDKNVCGYLVDIAKTRYFARTLKEKDCYGSYKESIERELSSALKSHIKKGIYKKYKNELLLDKVRTMVKKPFLDINYIVKCDDININTKNSRFFINLFNDDIEGDLPDFENLRSAYEEFKLVSKYIGIYNRLTDDGLDKIVKTEIQSRAQKVHDAIKELI